MPCLKCGGPVEEDAQLCDSCADSCLQEPKFFLNPVLVGPSIYSRLRAKGSAMYILGPTSGPDVITVPSAVLEKPIEDLNPKLMPHEDLKSFYQKCDAILVHQGVPLKLDSAEMLLTEDAVSAITTIVQKVNATESMFPQEAMSDLYVRMGVVYWGASRGILLRTTSKKWRERMKSYFTNRAKEYLSKVKPGEDLHSIAALDLGMLCLEAEEWTEAEEHLSDALRSFPDDLKISEGLAQAHLMLGNQVEALSKVDEIINLGESPALWVLKGRILRDMDRAPEAIECFNRALSLDPRFGPAHDIMIETLKATGRVEEAALAESQRSLSKRPGLERRISDLIAELKQVTAAPAAPEPAPKHPTPGEPQKAPVAPKPAPSIEISIDTARQALRAKDFDLAIQRATHLLKEKPTARDAVLVLIEAMILKGDIKEVAPYVHAFYERNREDSIAWYWRGVLARKEGRWGASIQYFSKAVSLDDKLLDAWISMGEVLLENGKTAGADESFSRALQLDDDSPAAWLGKAKTMKQMGRWGAAIQCLDRYNSLEPTDKNSWLLKADTLFDKEKYARAVEAYDKYAELAQADSYSLGKKGIALSAIGRTDEAKEALSESVRLDPNNKEAAKWLKAVSEEGEL